MNRQYIDTQIIKNPIIRLIYIATICLATSVIGVLLSPQLSYAQTPVPTSTTGGLSPFSSFSTTGQYFRFDPCSRAQTQNQDIWLLDDSSEGEWQIRVGNSTQAPTPQIVLDEGMDWLTLIRCRALPPAPAGLVAPQGSATLDPQLLELAPLALPTAASTGDATLAPAATPVPFIPLVPFYTLPIFVVDDIKVTLTDPNGNTDVLNASDDVFGESWQYQFNPSDLAGIYTLRINVNGQDTVHQIDLVYRGITTRQINDLGSESAVFNTAQEVAFHYTGFAPGTSLDSSLFRIEEASTIREYDWLPIGGWRLATDGAGQVSIGLPSAPIAGASALAPGTYAVLVCKSIECNKFPDINILPGTEDGTFSPMVGIITWPTLYHAAFTIVSDTGQIGPEDVVRTYYAAIDLGANTGDFTEAYGYLSEAHQRRRPFADYAAGFATTQSVRVESLTPIAATSTNATIQFVVVAVDQIGNQTVNTRYDVRYALIKENNVWKLDQFNARLIEQNEVDSGPSEPSQGSAPDSAAADGSVFAIGESARVDPVRASDNLRIRSGPGVSFGQLGSIPPNTIVTIQSDATLVQGSPWHLVAYGSLQGWVNANYLLPVPE